MTITRTFSFHLLKAVAIPQSCCKTPFLLLRAFGNAMEVDAVTMRERIRVNGAPAEATLEADGTLRWSSADGRVGVERRLSLAEEVLGVEAEGTRIIVKAFLLSPKGASCIGADSGVGKRVRRDYVLEMLNDEAARLWSQRFRDCIDSLGRPRRLFIIVNPFGGKKCATKIFHNEIQPLLAAAGILYTMKETEYQLHAQQIANTLDLLKYDGIVCVSGDGVLVEVVNGLLQREDWDAAIRVPLGIIPAGTGNGMAKSLLHAAGDFYSVSNATFAIIKGHKRSLDVATVLQGKAMFFSVLMLTWGLIADIDIESEKYRWMGSARLDFYSLLRIINLRKYHGRVQFVPAPGYETYGQPLRQNDGSASNSALCEPGQRDSDGQPLRQNDGSANNSALCEQGQRDSVVQTCGYPGALTSVEELEWRSIDGPFVSVWVNNVPWAGEDIMPAPEAKFSDGFLDAVIVRECSKSALLLSMLKMSDGSYVNSPHVMYLKVKAFRLEPGERVGHPTKGGIIDSDGEVIARGDACHDSDEQDYLMSYGPPIQMTVHQGLATIFSPQELYFH